MTSFKDLLQEDFEVFLAEDEFAEKLEFDGKEITAVRDDDVYAKRNQVNINYEGDGIFKDAITLFIRKEELDYKPVEGQTVTLEDEFYTVRNCREDIGMYTIELEANIG